MQKCLTIHHGQSSHCHGDDGADDGSDAVDDQTVDTLETDIGADDHIEPTDQDRGDQSEIELVLESSETGDDDQDVHHTQPVTPA